MTEENKNTKLDQLYPVHFRALSDANLLNKIQIPTLEHQQSSIMTTLTEEEFEIFKKTASKRQKKDDFY